MKYLLDTDTFSHMVKGISPAIVLRLQTLRTGEAALSIISRGEYLYGVSHAPLSKIREARANSLIDFFEVLPVDEPVAHAYGHIRAHLRSIGKPIGPNDLWIAEHAITRNLILVTSNTAEFERVPKLKVENWL